MLQAGVLAVGAVFAVATLLADLSMRASIRASASGRRE